MQALQVIELFAGIDQGGQPIVERLPVRVSEDNACQLVKSPAFVPGVASGDVIRLVPSSQEFNLVKRSGNLCIRVFCRGDITELANSLGSELEKLGAELDTETERMLVFSIHVSCGFSAIEACLNKYVGKDGQSAWFYGNVYDPADGTTPLLWWNEFLTPD